MAINMTAIRERLNNIKESEKKGGDERIWRPKGTQTFRIVPLASNPEFPFIEAYFNYNINKKTYLSPLTYGNPDPVMEFAQAMQEEANAANDKDMWKRGKKTEPKLKVFAPVIVRGEEEKGVRFWGFSKTIYEELLTYMDDPDWGDITDINTGRDIIIKVETPKEAGNDFGTTSIKLKPNQTKVTTDPAVIDLIKKQPAFKDVFPEPTYEELAQAWEKWITGAGQNKPAETSTSNNDAVADLFGGGGDAAPETVTKNVEGVNASTLDSTLDSLFGS